MGMMPRSIATVLACFALTVYAFPANGDPWKIKYEDRWGPIKIQRNGTGRPPYAQPLNGTTAATLRSLVDEWQSSTENTACDCTLFKQNLTVWNNAYVLPRSDHTTPMDNADYAELYQQRSLIEDVSFLLSNETLTSESDYPWTVFATPAPQERPITAAAFSSLLGFSQMVMEVPAMLEDADPTLRKALAKLDAKSLRAFQTTDKSFCHGFAYIVNPTFLISQRPDGTLVGVASTAIFT